MNTYLYAPKDDLKHRANWREPYDAVEAEALRALIANAQQRGVTFIYALGPGLDVRYSDPADFEHLTKRLGQMHALGCRDFALLFDDIPDRMSAEDQAHWKSFAAAQCALTNRLFAWAREREPAGTFHFCPTPYCGRMAARGLGGPGYLETVGRELAPEIEIFWTGPEIISREIPLAHLQEVTAWLRRKPTLWDNLHANDYDGHRFYCGPFAGRPPELRDAVAGILTNPNTEFPLNFIPLRTTAEFARGRGPWDPREAYLRALRDWLPEFATTGAPITFEDLLLLADAYYLPHEDGPEARTLFASAESLLASDPSGWDPGRVAEFLARAGRLRDCCARVAELRDRALFHALGRRVWELREELDLLIGYVRLKSAPGGAAAPAASDFHLPGTYRGGLVQRLQQLLTQDPDGTFRPSARPGSTPRRDVPAALTAPAPTRSSHACTP